MSYPFLVLCILLLIPVLIIYILRKDLRHAIMVTAICALPFGFTEFLFYRTYWEPEFLFDLAEKIGFGIEDFLFVSVLGGLCVSLYPFIFNLEYLKKHNNGISINRILLPIIAALTLTGVLTIFKIPMIWGSVPIMLSIALVICILQRSFFLPSLFGALFCAGFYFVVCLLLGLLIPNIFILGWHAEKFSNIYIASVPLEEITYAFSSGAIATIFYPYVFTVKFKKRNKTWTP